MNFNDFHIACFMSAARTCNFSAAAREFSVSQQVISRNIRQLETDLGFPLFLRNGQQVCLTDGGNRFFDWLTRLDNGISWGKTAFSNGENRSEIVACSDFCRPPEALMSAVAALRDGETGMDISIRVSSAPEIRGLLERQEIIAAVLPYPAALRFGTMPGMCVSPPFGGEPLYIMASRDYFDGDRPMLAQLSRLPLLLGNDGDGMSEYLCDCALNFLSPDGAARLEIVECPNRSSVLSQCACGVGFTVAASDELTRDRESAALYPLNVNMQYAVLSLCGCDSPALTSLLKLTEDAE